MHSENEKLLLHTAAFRGDLLKVQGYIDNKEWRAFTL